MPTKRISRNFVSGDLRSGHFSDLFIIGKSMGENRNSYFELQMRSNKLYLCFLFTTIDDPGKSSNQ